MFSKGKFTLGMGQLPFHFFSSCFFNNPNPILINSNIINKLFKFVINSLPMWITLLYFLTYFLLVYHKKKNQTRLILAKNVYTLKIKIKNINFKYIIYFS